MAPFGPRRHQLIAIRSVFTVQFGKSEQEVGGAYISTCSILHECFLIYFYTSSPPVMHMHGF